MKVIGNSHFQKTLNTSLILNHFREHGACSRIALSEETGLRPSTVTYIINRLMAASLVVEKKGPEPVRRNGRPPVLLSINNDYGRVIGVDLQADYYNGVVTDMSGTILKRYRKVYDKQSDSIEKLIKSILGEIVDDCADDNILGAGIAVPGTVDSERSMIIDCWTHDVSSRDLTGYFKEQFDFPVMIENDANCCAWKILWNDSQYAQNSMMYLLPRFHDFKDMEKKIPRIGIGLGLIMDGKIYRGSSCRAGEFRSAFLNTNGHKQILLDSDEAMNIREDSQVKRKFILELLQNMIAIVHLMNPKALLIGGDLSKESEMIFDVLENELAISYASMRSLPCALEILEEVTYDAAEGAAAFLLSDLYMIPQLDGQDLNLRRWNTMLSHDIE